MLSRSDKIPFKVISVDHIGLAPHDAKALARLLTIGLGLESHGSEVVAAQNTRTDFFSPELTTTRLELLQPEPADAGPIAKYLSNKRSGIHHLALRVDDIDTAVEWLRAKGFEFASGAPTEGAHNSRVIFLHPRSTGGILIELVAKA